MWNHVGAISLLSTYVAGLSDSYEFETVPQ